MEAWNIDQLVVILTRNSKINKQDADQARLMIGSALSLAKKFDGHISISTLKPIRSSEASMQVALMVASEIVLDLFAIVAAILSPPFLENLIQRSDLTSLFDEKIIAILEELCILKDYKIQDSTILNYSNHPDIDSPHIIAILLQVADFMRTYCSGALVEQDEEGVDTGGFSAEILLQLKCFYIPIVHRLYLYDVQTKLSDFWLKHADTLSYYYITAKLGMTKVERRRKLDMIAEEIESIMQAHGINFVIKNRIKSVYSIWNKIQKLNVHFEKIYDLSAIRIIILGTKDQTIEEEKVACWKIFTLLSQAYEPIYKIMRDWISVPKSSGYESLHLTLLTPDQEPFEVQIRTERMDHIAEYGNAAHWKYKSN